MKIVVGVYLFPFLWVLGIYPYTYCKRCCRNISFVMLYYLLSFACRQGHCYACCLQRKFTRTYAFMADLYIQFIVL